MKAEAAMHPSRMKGRRPKVSVVMPVLNGERHLRPAIESILAQDFGDFEFLVIDDGSTDGTADILRRFAKRDRRIKVFGRDHQGIVSALNFGLGEAQGEFLARMDADDVARPDRFGKQVATLSADPSTGVLGSYVECIDTDGLPIRVFEAPLTHGELDRLHMAEGGPRLWHPAVMMRTEILRRIGGYSADYPYTEDYDLWLRMGEVSRLATYPEPLLQYRLHLQSASVTKRGIQQDSASRALSAARARRGLPDAPVAASRKAPTELDVIRKWAWWALDAGNLSTARVYALKSLRLAPFSTASLKLCTSVLRAGR